MMLSHLFCVYLMNIIFITARGSTNTVVLSSLCDASLQKADANFIVTSATAQNITGPEDCTFVIQALKSNQMLAVEFVPPFLLEDDENNPLLPDGQGCRRSSLMIWDGDNEETDDLIGRYCGSETPTSFDSTGQFLTVRFFLNESAAANFTILYTSFDNGVCDDDVTELRCNNGRCVPRSVSCDLANNCGDNSDQFIDAPGFCTELATDELTLAESYLWLWILLGILGALVLALFLYWLLWRPGYLIWRLGCCRNLWYGCCCGQSGKYNKGSGDRASRRRDGSDNQDGGDFYDDDYEGSQDRAGRRRDGVDNSHDGGVSHDDDDDDGESSGCLCCRCCSSNDRQRSKRPGAGRGSISSLTPLHRPGLYKEGVMLPPDAGDRPTLHREDMMLPPDAIRPSIYKEDLIIPQYGPRPQLYKEGVILPPPEEQGRVFPLVYGIYHEDTIVPPPSTLITPSLVTIEDYQKDWDGGHAREAR